ncbi:peptidase [Rhizobium sp. Root149]|nr:peptidase [Rhizobium sp. Root149]
MFIGFSISVLTTLAGQANAADWQAVEQIKTYAITGKTGIDLYRSIGEKGPQAGVQAIAHTSFKLTWTRKYEVQGTACAITVAKPKLIITYTMPKPANPLPPDVEQNWARFIAGVEKHERVHGGFTKELVQQIQDFSLGLRVENDPDCKRIREVLTKRLGELSKAERARNAEFDRIELSDGGAVHQLILAFVNGP